MPGAGAIHPICFGGKRLFRFCLDNSLNIDMVGLRVTGATHPVSELLPSEIRELRDEVWVLKEKLS